MLVTRVREVLAHGNEILIARLNSCSMNFPSRDSVGVWPPAQKAGVSGHFG